MKPPTSAEVHAILAQDQARVEQCAVDGCDRRATDKGHCAAHAMQLRRYGEIRNVKLRAYARGATPCAVKGCDGIRFARGYCNAHYMRWSRSRDVQPEVPIKRRKGSP